jgi:kynurenine 3-monooxygenase
MPTLKNDFFNNPTSSLVTIRCYPWSFAWNAAIMGDAAHAVVPFYGQGMNAGFEDVRLFNNYLEEEGDWEAAFHTFEQEHKPDADAIADLALENFIEMRDKVADPQFLLRKKLEKKLEKRFTEQFQSVYAMVTFSHQPYSKALEMQQYQDRLFNELVSIPGVEEKVDNGALDERISKWLEG